ncbi:putative transcriptional activator ToxR [Vibrio cholerae]|uniref:winged helix-turn-helix domain-containing protein n=1 Tax=Vibrio cholerae TaxID=666 RepID=UPI00157ABF06|nr:winged helix-turn-helix domain-containing protein [Vibrio cholerae]EGR0593647.1 hypothetical protein [Vibrio cholerae]EJX9126030.1 winged helix-turn-helix domain-containing protein [Vibrio cholerae]EJY0789358.1 winged helix-turn-helix domain-containing protein [Vibrio cholerae]ELV5028155.1 winged helix-turn-helix domain-containing protein [Vibrio cholerae]CAB1261372.1 putative transcriptional activator ToxR [Vibrio cholerae]
MNNKRYFLGNGITFDALKREIIANQQILRLGGRESEILKLLCENPNMVLTKEDIHIKVWGSIYVSETSLTKAISNLRKSLSIMDNLCFEIKTIPKEGYIFISDSMSTVVPEELPEMSDEIEKNSSSYLSDLKVFGQKSDSKISYFRTPQEFRVMYFVLLSSIFSSSMTLFINKILM